MPWPGKSSDKDRHPSGTGSEYLRSISSEFQVQRCPFTKVHQLEKMKYWLEPDFDRQGGGLRNAGRMQQVFDGVKQRMAPTLLESPGEISVV